MKKFAIAALATVFLAGCTGTPTPLGTRAEAVEADKISVVKFSDFNCPACASAQPVAREVQRMDDVYYEHRHFPLDIPGHELSLMAAIAYECAAKQGVSNEVGIALFDAQRQMTEEIIAEIPTAYGLDIDTAAYQTCVAEEETIDTVMSDLRAALRMGLNSTPTFLVNGERVPSNQVVDAIAAARAN